MEQGVPQAPLVCSNGLGFDAAVPTSGYRWWYVDAFSDDGRAGLTLIAFVGSVFSPYYARARRRGDADPEHYCSLNAVFYGPDRKRWALTERGRGDLSRSAAEFRVGPSRLTFRGNVLDVAVDEVTVPFPGRLRGRVRVEMPRPTDACFALDPDGLHRWWPVAPVARVSVDLNAPTLSWRGAGYVDSNGGSVALEDTFAGWHWAREAGRNGDCRIVYDAHLLDGKRFARAFQASANGSVHECAAPPEQSLPRGPVWRVRRTTLAEPAVAARVLRTYEDTPFYTRSKLALTGPEGTTHAMHESLDLTRFRRGWVQSLLPFRMPRRART